MPLILSGNVASAIGGGYEVANSCRFNSGDDAYMHITPGSAGNKRIWTFSTWFKRGKLGADRRIFSTDGSAGSSYGAIQFGADDRIVCWSYNHGAGGFDQYHRTNRLFRDTSAWYHMVMAVDTTQGSASNRTKIYFNGVQETSWLTETTHDQNDDSEFNHDTKWWLGTDDNQDYNFDGYMAETVFIDGTQYAASDFGEFDEDSPTIWKPKDVSGLTFGTNGFYLDFEDSANLGNDANGGTDLTEVNLAATDQTTDTPTNNFCTMNPLDNFYYDATFSEGNLKLAQPSDTECYPTSTIAVSQGKWYWEIKITSSGSSKDFVGIADKVATASDFSPFSGNSNMLSYYGSNGDSKAGSTGTSYGATFTTGDIIGVAMDLDNNKLYFSKNGSFQDSGDPTSGATGTGALSINASPADGVWYAQFSNIHNTASTFEANFGNPTFTISSGNADDNGYGNFEYDVPSGYYALCTKNLAEFG